MSGIDRTDDAAIKRYLESKNFDLTDQDKIELGKKCMGLFSKIVSPAKQHDVFLKKANKKINSCAEASVLELQKQKAWVNDVINAFPTNKMHVVKFHKEVSDILKECPEKYRDNLRKDLLAKMKEGPKTLYEGEEGALGLITSFIQVTEVKKIYKTIFGEECSATTAQEVKEQFLKKIGGEEAIARGVDVVKIASMPLDKQKDELVTRTVASRREPLAKQLDLVAKDVQSTKAEREMLLQKQAGIREKIERLSEKTALLEENLMQLLGEKNEIVASKATRYQSREEEIGRLTQEVKTESSKFFGKDTKKLDVAQARLAWLQKAKADEQAKIDELDTKLQENNENLEKTAKELFKLAGQLTSVGKEVDSCDAFLSDCERNEKDLQKELDSLEYTVEKEVGLKSPEGILKELIAPAAVAVAEPEEEEVFEGREPDVEPVTTALAPELPVDAAIPAEVKPNQAVQSLIDSVSDDISSVSNLISRLVTPLGVKDDSQLKMVLSSHLSMAVLPIMQEKFEQAQSRPGLLQTVIPLLSEHLSSATSGETPDIRILNALKSVLNDVCNVLATPKSNQDSEAPKKSASLELLAKSLPLLDALKANKAKNDKMTSALTVVSPALSLLGNAFGRSIAVGRVLAVVEKKLVPVVLTKTQKKALEQTISELLKKISDSGMLNELKDLVAATANYLKSKDMPADTFVQVASPILIKVAQMLDVHFIMPASSVVI